MDVLEFELEAIFVKQTNFQHQFRKLSSWKSKLIFFTQIKIKEGLGFELETILLQLNNFH
jgi:hypothetical protein